MLIHPLESQTVRINDPVDRRHKGHDQNQGLDQFQRKAGLWERDDIGHVDDLDEKADEKSNELPLDRFYFLFHDGLGENLQFAVEVYDCDQVYDEQKDTYGEVNEKGCPRCYINPREVDE